MRNIEFGKPVQHRTIPFQQEESGAESSRIALSSTCGFGANDEEV
jgi:hypothetical protein